MKLTKDQSVVEVLRELRGGGIFSEIVEFGILQSAEKAHFGFRDRLDCDVRHTALQDASRHSRIARKREASWSEAALRRSNIKTPACARDAEAVPKTVPKNLRVDLIDLAAGNA
jgi:hypothetical protein